MKPGSKDLLWCWRHPKAVGQGGAGPARCIGRTDLAVDPRKARRLAGRIRAAARRHGLPRRVWVSPLERCRAVGEVLQCWGFELKVDARLVELDFGRWDGQPWSEIPAAEVDAWAADLLHHAPGGGESLAQLAERVQSVVHEATAEPRQPRLVVSHGGWINALLHLPPGIQTLPAHLWPPAPAHGSCSRFAACDVQAAAAGCTGRAVLA
jgi:alpha-ribazole phosphatase